MIVLIIALGVIILDQVSKYLALGLRGNSNIIILEDFLEFTYLENRGAAFGILQGRSLIFIVIALGVVLYMAYFLYKNPHIHTLVKVAFGLIIGGAIGNLIDRVLRGFVVDFIFVRFWGYYDFPVFNIADMGVVIGVLILLGLTFFTDILDGVD